MPSEAAGRPGRPLKNERHGHCRSALRQKPFGLQRSPCGNSGEFHYSDFYNGLPNAFTSSQQLFRREFQIGFDLTSLQTPGPKF